MKLSEYCKWFNRHGTAPLLAVALLMACLETTRRAANSPGLSGSNTVGISLLPRQALTVQFLARHEWATGFYFCCFNALLVYFAWRRLPFWVTGCTCTALAAPWVIYLIRLATFATQQME